MDSDEEYASDDIVFEILSRTSLETLHTCKAVSKRWKQIIYEPTFMSTYQERRKNMFGYFIQDMRRCKYVSKYVSADQSKDLDCVNVSEDTRILASCNHGILCCEKLDVRRKYRYYICKPVTKQWLALPNPKLRYRTVAVAVVVVKARPLTYKIFRLSRVPANRNMVEHLCEIFDSETWMWRATHGVNLRWDEMISRPVISVGGCVYLLTDKDNVLAFDFAQECFQKFSVPESIRNNNNYKWRKLVEYEGGLGFTCVSREGKMELWVWRRSHGWTIKTVIDDEYCANFELLGFYNGGVAVMKAMSCYEIVFYELKNRSLTRVRYSDEVAGTEFFQFRSDLESVDLRGGS